MNRGSLDRLLLFLRFLPQSLSWLLLGRATQNLRSLLVLDCRVTRPYWDPFSEAFWGPYAKDELHYIGVYT